MKKIISFIGVIICSLALFSCKDKGFEEVELSDKMKEQIALDYDNHYSKGDSEHRLGKGWFSSYGKYKNIYFISCSGGTELFDVIQEFATENSYVRIYSSNWIYAYYNHNFYDIKVLYRLGIVSEEAVLDLCDYANEHPLFADTDSWQYLYLENKIVSI
ncbi:MAG: hypothetical protein K2K48_04660 [Anaeroplasmataceae bacterium]|nr:hypothetical protein [Anaeroplasmataceae bacterium]MDE6414685.1 hypothetical protein [Anaeroplasmataceae bacterium]